jgi:hypothetical protein
MRTRNPELDLLAADAGIVFDQALDFLPRLPGVGHNGGPPLAMDSKFGALNRREVELAIDEFMGAMDAPNYNQQSLITQPNAGIPAFLTTYLDPKLIEVLLTPLKAEDIYGVAKKGDWTSSTLMFMMVEMTGEVSGYGDFNENGRSDANVNYPQRQPFLWQTMTEWGERQLAVMEAGRVDWASRLNISSANTLNRFMNLVYFFGVSGLQNYGGLNDPSLSAALTPATKAAGGTGWQHALPTEILADGQALFANLITQSPGNVTLDSRMTWAMHPQSELYMANTNSFGLTGKEMVMKVFPNVTIKTAPEYLSGSTYSCQLIVDEWFDGQRTAEASFTEKMRAHGIVKASSSWKQKKSAGASGTIIYRPIGIAQMAGL